jgi:hypothetical protein
MEIDQVIGLLITQTNFWGIIYVPSGYMNAPNQDG